MKRLVGSLSLLLLSGCGKVDQALDALAGNKSQTVALAKGPLTLGPSTVELTSPEPLKVLGSQATLCIVLKGGVPLGPQQTVDHLFEESLRGAKIVASITRGDGQTFDLEVKNQAWRRDGVITSSELAACSSCGCSSQQCRSVFPKDAVISNVKLSSSAPLPVLGVYWSSTNAFDFSEEDKKATASALNLQCDASARRR